MKLKILNENNLRLQFSLTFDSSIVSQLNFNL